MGSGVNCHTNSSNNTVYADADGNIAYFHANFIPRRDPSFDWRKPVDGSNPATEWNGVLSFEESPNVVNPPNGWVYNTNNFPFSAAGKHSPKQSDFPAYIDAGAENPRGIHAMRVLDGQRGFSVDSLIAAAYDSAMPEFETQIPLLRKAYADLPITDPRKAQLAEATLLLKGWDCRFSNASVPMSIAMFYGERLLEYARPAALAANVDLYRYMQDSVTAEQRHSRTASQQNSVWRSSPPQ
jgi:acyl-homoserine-lactone acylase